jgi:hypothetical protein
MNLCVCRLLTQLQYPHGIFKNECSLKLFSKVIALNLSEIGVTFEVATSTLIIILNFIITIY